MPTIDHSDFRLVAGDDWRIVETPHTLVRFQTPLLSVPKTPTAWVTALIDSEHDSGR